MTQEQRIATDRLMTALHRHLAMMFAVEEDLEGWAQACDELDEAWRLFNAI